MLQESENNAGTIEMVSMEYQQVYIAKPPFPFPFPFPIRGKEKGRVVRPGKDLNQEPWDLHANPLPIMLTWVPVILGTNTCILTG